jgi:hypothetical protein
MKNWTDTDERKLVELIEKKRKAQENFSISLGKLATETGVTDSDVVIPYLENNAQAVLDVLIEYLEPSPKCYPDPNVPPAWTPSPVPQPFPFMPFINEDGLAYSKAKDLLTKYEIYLSADLVRMEPSAVIRAGEELEKLIEEPASILPFANNAPFSTKLRTELHNRLSLKA